LLAAGLAAQAPATPPAAVEKVDYGKPESWLCRPGRTDDACAIDLTTTIIAPNGTMTRETFTPHPSPPIDCFYVYPTVSYDPPPYSDMAAGNEERNVIRQQFARFRSQCRTYAPLYRQIPVGGLKAVISGTQTIDRGQNYDDVLAAWQHYVSQDNAGRPVVIIGHSQGAMLLTRLIAEEIDGKPLQSRLVSAMLLGTTLPVPKGRDVGGAFKTIPLCRKAGQTGCVITFASFRSTIPPPANTLFGQVTADGMEAACTNPAALAGGSGVLHAYLGVGSLIAMPGGVKHQWTTSGAAVDTPFVSLPGMLSAKCAANEHANYLELTVAGDPADARADDIPGDLAMAGKPQPNWGMHLVDVNLAMGNLLDIVAQQSKAWKK
jgi:hypothetical protein